MSKASAQRSLRLSIDGPLTPRLPELFRFGGRFVFDAPPSALWAYPGIPADWCQTSSLVNWQKQKELPNGHRNP